jgi:NitT/TauT family transport system substrate-binding protein
MNLAIVGLGAVLTVAAVSGYSVISSAYAADKVKFGLPNGIGITETSANFAASVELGYFKDEGLDVDFVVFNGSAVVLPQVVSRTIDIGWGGPDILITGKQPGRDNLPLKFFYNWQRTSIWEFAVLESSQIYELKDLKGKSVGVNFLAGGQIPQTEATLESAGLKVGRDVDLVATGYGPPAFLALTSNRVQALDLLVGQNVLMENRGIKIRRLKIPDKFQRLFSDGFYAHNDTIAARGDVLSRFGRAVAKGTVACEAALDNCIRMLWKMRPNLKPGEGPEDKKLNDAVRVLTASIKQMVAFGADAPRNFGEFTEERWRDYIQIFTETKRITADIPMSELYTSQFVSEFNRFDVAAVRQQALTYK